MSLFEIYDPKAPPKPIGIDLGTTNSLVAYVKNGRPEVVADCNGDALVPSVVAYEPDGRIAVGRAAERVLRERPITTIASAKRYMGRGADDPETRRLGPYMFLPPAAGEPNVVRFVVGERTVTPVEVSAEILRELRRRAEDELRHPGGVVITVPAYFDDAQRQATKDAGRLAGLEVLRLLNEPTAAALAYGLEKKQNGTFAVYDLGGGTFDVTILLLDEGVFQVKSTGGDSALGGDDMDRAVAHELLRELGYPQGSDVSPKAVRALLDAARAMKHALSDESAVEAPLPAADGHTRNVRITRARFEELIMPLLERTGAACKRALKDAGLGASKLDGVILVGGATRVPAVQAYVAKLFGRAPLMDIDPEQVVALGAALQADLLAGEGRPDDVLLLDVLPLSLGIEVGGGIVDKILPRNTTIPTRARATYTTQEDGQTGFEIHVLQGERELAADCRSLAHFTLRGIPPMAAGLAKLEVTFGVDADGLLHVDAKELTTGKEQSVAVKPSYGLDDETVERMLLDALDHGEEDLERRRLLENQTEAHRLLAVTSKALRADEELLLQGERESIELAMRELEGAAKGTDTARIHDALDALDGATRGFATRRMNRAVKRAIEGKSVDEVAPEAR